MGFQQYSLSLTDNFFCFVFLFVFLLLKEKGNIDSAFYFQLGIRNKFSHLAAPVKPWSAYQCVSSQH